MRENTTIVALSGKLATKNKFVHFRPGSILNNIGVEHVRVEISKEASLVDVSDKHRDTVKDSVAAKIAKTVQGEIGFYHEVVKTHIEEVEDTINAAVEKELKSPLFDVDARMLEIPTWITNANVWSEVQSMADDQVRNIATFYAGPKATNMTDMVARAMTGNVSLDAVIKEWMEALGNEFLSEVWNRWFVDGKIFGDMGTATPRKMTELALVWVWANAAIDNPIEGYRAELTNYKNFMRDVAKAAATRLVKAREFLERGRNLGTLITFTDRAKGVIYIDPVTFKTFTNEGGDMDVIYGWYVSTTTERSANYRNLVENADKYRKAFNTATESKVLVRKARISKAIAAGMEVALHKFMLKPQEHAAEFFAANPNIKEKVLKEAKDFIANVRTRSYQEDRISSTIQNLAIRLVTRTFFPFTNASVFFFKMKDVLEDNPNMEPAEAAKFAGVALVCRFVAGELVVTEQLAGK